jgi:hypothetical protein
MGNFESRVSLSTLDHADVGPVYLRQFSQFLFSVPTEIAAIDRRPRCGPASLVE